MDRFTALDVTIGSPAPGGPLHGGPGPGNAQINLSVIVLRVPPRCPARRGRVTIISPSVPRLLLLHSSSEGGGWRKAVATPGGLRWAEGRVWLESQHQ